MLSKNQLKYVRQMELKKFRKREGLFVAEGPKVVGDLIAAGYVVHKLFATPEWRGPREQCQDVTADELQRLSFLQHPQQVLALFQLPAATVCGQHSSGLAIAIDGVQDPGNLGTIIRIADWFDIPTIYCSEDTVDAYSPKVVQATMGSIARVNIVYTNLADVVNRAIVPVYATLLDGNNIYHEQLPSDAIIVMGNEGNGISPAIRQLITHKLLIPPFHQGPDSLNVAVATAIVCSEFRRKGQK